MAELALAALFAAAPVTETSLDLWRQQLELNATSAFLVTREVLRVAGPDRAAVEASGQ